MGIFSQSICSLQSQLYLKFSQPQNPNQNVDQEHWKCHLMWNLKRTKYNREFDVDDREWGSKSVPWFYRAPPNWFYAARTMELQPGQIAVRPVNQEGGLHRFRSSWSRIFSFFINSKKLCFFFLLVNNKSQCSVDVSCSRLRFLGRETEAKTKTNFLKDPTYAIFLKSLGFKDIKYETHASSAHHQCIISA